MAIASQPKARPGLQADLQWYKDAIIYQTHVRAYADSDGDGIGDFRGLTSKLGYLQDLGVTAIWLLPFYPSPLRDGGYDIADYTNVNDVYGTLADFKAFMRAAHERGLRVITELVLNHTSDQHKWFQRARQAKPGEPYRDFYVWSDTPDKYSDARIIFKDFETSNWTWDPVAGAYYWHRFYSHQPDLNYENPHVKRAMYHILDHWLKMGVDGLRLDAVPYLHEREGTSCENLPETHQVLKEVRAYIDEHYPGRMLLAEANQWPEDAVAYFGAGDECHTCFHFPLMPRLFMSVEMEDRFPLVDILRQTPAIPDVCQWIMFLRNHDELTLEMVTDEERDYMYRVYASDRRARINLGIRRRLAPLLQNNRRKIELLNALLFSMPGTPVIYYGDEIGMGDNIYLGDRDGVRTPMQWSSDRNGGFSSANPQRLYLPPILDFEYHYESVNVETQSQNPESLLWWMKRLIALRQNHLAFSRGSFEMLAPRNGKVLAFVRSLEDEHVIVVANLSRHAQAAELDLSRFEGARLVEMFGQSKFPTITKSPYTLTLGPYSFYWFSVVTKDAPTQPSGENHVPPVQIHDTEQWAKELLARGGAAIQRALLRYVRSQRWYGGKARTIQTSRLTDVVPLGSAGGESPAHAAILNLEFTQGEAESYVVPIALARGGEAERLTKDRQQLVIARARLVDQGNEDALIYDPTGDERYAASLLEVLHHRHHARGVQGEIVATSSPLLKHVLADGQPNVTPAVGALDQSNTSIAFGDQFILKLFRRLHPGENPDLEVTRFLTETAGFEHTPKLAGSLEYQIPRAEPATLAVLQQFVANQGTAWRYTRDSLSRYFERVLAEKLDDSVSDKMPLGTSLVEMADMPVPAPLAELIGEYLVRAELLGQRTAEMHQALASDPTDSVFAPEAFTFMYQRSIYQSIRQSAARTFELLSSKLDELSPTAQAAARQVLAHDQAIVGCVKNLIDEKLQGKRIRIHGDYHLGQVLYTGKDFVIIDFEGEPARPLSERRIKRSPLQDVAGMIRSFHYAASDAYLKHVESLVGEDDRALVRRAAGAWYLWTSATFLKGYLGQLDQQNLVPRTKRDIDVLLTALLLDKAIYELAYELNNRPKWVEVPLRGLLDLLENSRCTQGANGT